MTWFKPDLPRPTLSAQAGVQQNAALTGLSPHRLIAAGPGRRPGGLRRQHHLDAVVLLVPEDLVHRRRVIEFHAVGDDEAGVDFSLLNPLEERLHIPLDVAL